MMARPPIQSQVQSLIREAERADRRGRGGREAQRFRDALDAAREDVAGRQAPPGFEFDVGFDVQHRGKGNYLVTPKVILIHTESGQEFPGDTPLGQIPAGGVPGDVPGTFVIPQQKYVHPKSTKTVPAPSLGPFPIPGFQPGPGGMPGQVPGQGPLPGDYGPPIPGSLPAVMGAGQQMLGAYGQIPFPSDFEGNTAFAAQMKALVGDWTGSNPAAIGPVSAYLANKKYQEYKNEIEAAAAAGEPHPFGGQSALSQTSPQFQQGVNTAGQMIAQPYVEQFEQAAGQFGSQLMQGLTPTPVQAQAPHPLAGTSTGSALGIDPLATIPIPGQTMPFGTPPLMQGLPTLSDIGNMIFGPVPGQIGQAVMNPSIPPAPAMPGNIPPMFPTTMPPAPPLPTTFP